MTALFFLPAENNGRRASLPRPGIISQAMTSMLQLLSTTACLHPIRTICIITVLASTTYIRITRENLEFFHGSAETDWNSMTAVSPKLIAGPETGWEWHGFETEGFAIETVLDHLALVTLAFPTSPIEGQSAQKISLLASIVASNISMVQTLPTSNDLAAYTQCTTIALSLKYTDGPEFLDSIETILYYGSTLGNTDDKMWIMKPDIDPAVKGLTQRLRIGWTEFLDLLNHAEKLDIIMVTLGYVLMLRTFISLFISMKKMGSRLWLATSVILSSTFAFLFGLHVTLRLGVPISMVALSEGLPFLAVTVGFEKNILLTRAVLSHAVEHHKPQQPKREKQTKKAVKTKKKASDDTIQYCVKNAIRDTGYNILLNYAIEIALLASGAASGVQRLHQFCVLAIFTLLFDCILLFTLYISVLCIKVELNRIKRLINMRRALEDDGLSPRIAESVAKSIDPKHEENTALLGTTKKTSVISSLKFFVMAGFLGLNAYLLSFNSSADFSYSTISTWVAPPSLDPFDLAGDGLDQVLFDAKSRDQATLVTVMPLVRYELQDTAVNSSILGPHDSLQSERVSSVGGNTVDSLLASAPNQVLSKWALVALALSIGLNGYLFKTTRLEIRESHDDGSTAPLSQESSASRRVVRSLNDEEVIDLCLRGKLPGYSLERRLEDCDRAVRIRRAVVSRTPLTRHLTGGLEGSKLPYEEYDWERVLGACCENVIGYTPVPVGVAGPLVVDGRPYFIPMATTEGVLVASTSRGSKAVNLGGGIVTVLTGDGMTRAPCVSFETLERAGSAKLWLDSEVGQDVIKSAFESTSRYMHLKSIKTTIAGTNLYIQFKATTGDAMGMNMISKGVEYALEVMRTEGFDDMQIITLSSNYCSDKKPSAINWLDGRGKGVVAEAIIPGSVVQEVLKSDIDSMVELAMSKLLVGSAMAGSIGGFNANAANLVAAIFIATGQDPAQVVEGANCITTMKK